MAKNIQGVFGIPIRYIFLALIALPNLYIFYFIFTPLTVYPIYFMLSLFFEASLIGNIVLVNNETAIHLIEACIAGSAYYLLLILNLSTAGIKLKKRVGMILLSFASLLIINLIRIFLLSLLFISGSLWFDFTHKLFWYSLSVIFVIAIWFAEVRIFKIKNIPVYSDIKFLYKNSSLKMRMRK